MPERQENGRRLRGISAIITCYNEEANIADCIESLSWCDEIVVVDSFSTDRTPEIARTHDKVQFLQRQYYGGASQKNWAIDRTRHEWILILDADERCTTALREEIQGVFRWGPEYNAYTIARRVYFLGRLIRFSGWQHDRVSRLFRHGYAWYENRRVHAPLVTVGRSPLLSNPMDHFMVDSLEEYVDRITRYGHWGAAQWWIDGRPSHSWQVLVRPTWRFLRTYLLQLGILDGSRGLTFCALQAYGTFVKCALVWSWKINAARGLAPDLPAFDEDVAVWRGLDHIQHEQQTTD